MAGAHRSEPLHTIVERDLAEEVERYRARLSEHSGVSVSRSEAVRSLLRRGLKHAAQAQCHAGPPALVLGRAPR